VNAVSRARNIIYDPSKFKMCLEIDGIQ